MLFYNTCFGLDGEKLVASGATFAWGPFSFVVIKEENAHGNSIQTLQIIYYLYTFDNNSDGSVDVSGGGVSPEGQSQSA